MDGNMKIAQLRCTIFIKQSLGYTPDLANKLRELTVEDGKVFGVPQSGMPLMLGVDPNEPQYGAPWRISSEHDGKIRNIIFQPGKIDVVLTCDTIYDAQIEKDFIKQSIDWFGSILAELDETVIRAAYAPLYAIEKTDEDNLWDAWLKKTTVDGKRPQDVNLSFLLKHRMEIAGRSLGLNLLHNIFDGKQTKTQASNVVEVKDVLLFQLDINTLPDSDVQFAKDELRTFFNEVIGIKDKLVNNVH